MDESNDAQGRTRRRRDAMTASLTVSMTPDMRAEVEKIAAADEVSAADVVRQCLAETLPKLRDRQRRRRRSS